MDIKMPNKNEETRLFEKIWEERHDSDFQEKRRIEKNRKKNEKEKDNNACLI